MLAPAAARFVGAVRAHGGEGAGAVGDGRRVAGINRVTVWETYRPMDFVLGCVRLSCCSRRDGRLGSCTCARVLTAALLSVALYPFFVPFAVASGLAPRALYCIALLGCCFPPHSRRGRPAAPPPRVPPRIVRHCLHLPGRPVPLHWLPPSHLFLLLLPWYGPVWDVPLVGPRPRPHPLLPPPRVCAAVGELRGDGHGLCTVANGAPGVGAVAGVADGQIPPADQGTMGARRYVAGCDGPTGEHRAGRFCGCLE